MTFNYINKLLGNKENIKNIIVQMRALGENAPFIVREIVGMLEDNCVYSGIIPDNNKVALACMLQMYFDKCFEYFDQGETIAKTAEYGGLLTYKVNAPNGLRFATTGEIANGVENLIGEMMYPATKEVYKNLQMFAWTLVGGSYHIRRAGYKLDYDKEGKVVTNTYEILNMSFMQIKEVLEWVGTPSYDKSLKILNKFKKSRGYHYAAYEKDEIQEQISIKQLINTLDKVLPRNSDNARFRKAIALIIKTNKYDKKLEPLEIAELRQIYKEIVTNSIKAETQVLVDVKSKCEKLLQARDKNMIKHNHFVFVIIPTLQKSGYTRASDKQMAVINDAIALVKKAEERIIPETTSNVITEEEVDNTLANLSNAIGNGLFEEDDEDE